MDWNYDMNSCPLDTKVCLLSGDGNLLLPQQEFIGTITDNGRFKTRTERIDSKEIKLGHEIILLNKDLNVIKTYINAEWAKKEDGYEQSALRACVNRKKIIKYKEMFCLLKDEYDFIVLSVKKEYINDFLNSYLVKGNILIKNKEEREKHILNFIDSYYYK